MIDFLLGVPGKLKSISDFLTTNWTIARAAKVDNLDAAMSTRAPAGTALSNGVWTQALANSLWTMSNSPVSVVQSIQSGDTQIVVSTANPMSVTIAAVNTAKAIAFLRGSNNSFVQVTLVNSTTISLHTSTTSGADIVSWTVLEFK